MKLTPVMQEALALVPNDWKRVPSSVLLNGRHFRYLRFVPAYVALQRRSLVEFREIIVTRHGEMFREWQWRRIQAGLPTTQGVE